MVEEEGPANPYAGLIPTELQPPQRSRMVTDTIEYNAEQIRETAWIAALQAMPMLLARGIPTDIHKQSDLLQEKIEEMVRHVIDERDTFHQDNIGIYSVEVCLAQHFGEGINHRERNVYQVDVNVSINLSNGNYYFEPSHYRAAKRWGDRQFGQDEAE